MTLSGIEMPGDRAQSILYFPIMIAILFVSIKKFNIFFTSLDFALIIKIKNTLCQCSVSLIVVAVKPVIVLYFSCSIQYVRHINDNIFGVPFHLIKRRRFSSCYVGVVYLISFSWTRRSWNIL